MTKKHTSVIFTAAICLLCCTLTGCSDLPRPASYYQNQDDSEAESLVQENRQAFIDKVAEAYGDSAVLSDIECVRVFPGKYNPGYKSYTKTLKGTLTVNGKRYEALYDCYKGSVRDSVHTDAICSELTGSLPLDQSKILDVFYPESTGDWDYGVQWKFPSQVTTFDEAVTWETGSEAPITIWICTAEDVSDLTEADFTPIPQMQKVIDSAAVCKITIISLADKAALDVLKEDLRQNPNNFERLLYPSAAEKDIADTFSKYHMTNILKVGNGSNSTSNTGKPALEFKKAKE